MTTTVTKPVLFKNIKSYLSGTKNIRETPKGNSYKIFNKTNTKQAISGRAAFFNDYGDKAQVIGLKYTKGLCGKYNHNIEINLWFKIVNNKLQFSTILNGNYRIVSNRVMSKLYHTNPVFAQNFKGFLIKWCNRNGLQVKKKYYKYNLGKLLNVLCYPALEYIFDVRKDCQGFQKIDSLLTKKLGPAAGLNEGLDRIFGFHGKKLKALLFNETNLYMYLQKGVLFKNLITKDDYFNIAFGEQFIQLKQTRFLIKNFGRETIMNWFVSGEGQKAEDASRMFYENNYTNKKDNQIITLPNSNNLEEVHDSISLQYRQFKGLKVEKPTNYKENLEKLGLQDFSFGEFEVKIPTNSKQLINAGAELSNCLASYTKAHTNNLIIFLVYKKEELKYAISIRNKELEQFYGKHNSMPQREDYEIITNELKNKKILANSHNFDNSMEAREVRMVGGEF